MSLLYSCSTFTGLNVRPCNGLASVCEIWLRGESSVRLNGMCDIWLRGESSGRLHGVYNIYLRGERSI